jgi:hypothetical protein
MRIGHCKPTVWRFSKRPPLIMGQRMSGQKRVCFKQVHQGSQSGFRNNVFHPRCVLSKPPPPILLPLTAQTRKPSSQSDLPEETQKNRKPGRLKPPIIQMGPECMDRSTVRTPIPLQQECSFKLIKKPAHITMTPQPRTSTPWTPRRTRPRILLSHLLQELDIEIAIQYQVRSLGGITGDSSPGRDSSSVIPFLSLHLTVRRKKTYTTNGEILGRVLGKTM